MKYAQDSTASEQGPIASYCEHGNEPSNSTEGENYLNSRNSIISSGWTMLLGNSNTKRVTSK